MKSAIIRSLRAISLDARRQLVRIERRLATIRVRVRRHVHRYVREIEATVLLFGILASAYLAPRLQTVVGPYFDSERFALLRNVLIAMGGALVGATAVGFSVVMIAVQLNFARMPHGLFRKLSSDARLLGSFAATFLLAIAVSAVSFVPDKTWSAASLIAAAWSTLLILTLFFYGYRRALALINPRVQLGIIVSQARKDLRRWARRAKRIAPLLDVREADGARPSHDLARLAFFQANPHWTRGSDEAISYAMSFARRYAEQGDLEVAGAALNAVVTINAEYVVAKGKTFFAPNPIFDIPQATDTFINQTLERLRQAAQAATSRAEEEPLRQLFGAMTELVRTYMGIDYANPHVEGKHHAQLAAAYLASAVEAVLPRRLPDVVMEGVRLMGICAQLFLAVGETNSIIVLKEKIVALSCTGAVREEFRPVTLVGMEQLARMTSSLLRLPSHDIRFAADQIRNGVELVVKVFLEVPDTPLSSVHSTYLAPYYSLTKTDTLGSWLTDLFNAVISAPADDKSAKAVLRNVDDWAEDLYRTQKTLLLLSIEKNSHFTFDILHWIAHITMLLVAAANARAAEEFIREKLERHASSLISVLSWIPDDAKSTAFAETFSTTELIFKAAFDAMQRSSERVLESARRVLIDWTFKAGRYSTGRGTLEAGLKALAALALSSNDARFVTWLKNELTTCLAAEQGINADLRDTTARNLRRAAISFRRREFEFKAVDRVMGQVDPGKLRQLLTDVANLLSPNTAPETVEPDTF